MLAAEIQSDLLILMSDVDGIYNKPPWEDGAKLMSTYTTDDRNQIKFGQKSKVGTGGMDSKVNAATWALDRGVSVVICNGTQEKAIKTIISGRKVGTFFTETTTGDATPVDVLAENGKCKRTHTKIESHFFSLQHVSGVVSCNHYPHRNVHHVLTP